MTKKQIMSHPHPIDTWIFDLDNTLYHPSVNLFAQVDARMTEFIARELACDPVAARKIQKEYFRKFGTTLSGLMALHDTDPHHFLDYVHDIDYALLQPDAALTGMLEGLQGRKLIFTNGSQGHAEQVLEKLNIVHFFEDIFDIAATSFTPKPERAAFEHVVKAANITPRNAAMVEDIERNLEVPHQMGMHTILVDAGSFHGDTREPWEYAVQHAHYVDVVVGDVRDVRYKNLA